MATQVILLERVEKLGQMGDVVNVKPGYARNYLLPQKKALRASEQNIAYFEAQKKVLQAESDQLKKEAEKKAKTIEGVKVPLIRQASESGTLFGSVNSRDIAQAASEKSGESISRQMVTLNENFKMIGLFPVSIILHPEVSATITINIARTQEEAEIQDKTGKALIAEETSEDLTETTQDEAAETETDMSDVLEESAIQIEAEKAEAAAEKEAKDQAAEAKRAEKAEKKAQKSDASEEDETAEAADENSEISEETTGTEEQIEDTKAE